MSGAYYNEIDPYAAQWLRNLIAAGHIAPGDVDERSIEDVHPDDLKHYTQCHFFAGIGVWSLALRRSGWPDDRPVWTGSCPCQPYSQAGKGLGIDDPRHLWPSWAWLIGERLPAVVLGEQVASKAVDHWIDLVQADLEAMGYAVGGVPFPAAGVGSPNIRDRLYWVGESTGIRRARKRAQPEHGKPLQAGKGSCWVGNTNRDRGGRHAGAILGSEGGTAGVLRRIADCPEPAGATCNPGPVNGLWADADWILCRDGKWRPVEPGTFPLAHGAPSRVGRLRAYGNAINAEAATQFIAAYLDATS
ncbi:DNA cytosine methyltransferase [Pseudomonas aeruginosa]|uniref:DNA cytosine methyltransferase n=1 Tax=Pseudomonas aeruginosa TaxID=287 RepID=UPI001558E23A|nr:DNA cytosine methyltransferase [Pseudomonas aeruginosa]NPW76493.1 DNA cytosine methyltransferase [Pseudomonas aeruginosa]